MRLNGRLLSSIVVAIVAAFILAGCGSAVYGGGGSKPTAAPAATGDTRMGTMAGATAAVRKTGTTVAIQNFAFSPQTLTVKVGATVTWTNADSSPHTVTSADSMSVNAKTTGLFDSGSLASGKSFSFTFTRPGTYFYECTIHFTMPSMHGKIVVK